MMLELFLTSSALILAVFLIRALFGRSMGAGLRYGLWLLVLARLLIPVSIGQSAVSPANLTRAEASQGVVYTVPIAHGTPEELGVRVSPGTGAVSDANSMGYAVPNADGTVTRYAAKAALPGLLPLLWKLGMAAAAIWFALCNLFFWRDVRRTRRPLECEGRLRVYLARVPSPCLFGLLRPAVYLTEAAAADEAARSHVLLHERTHLRHGDHIWAFLRTVCLVIWWFNPLVWAAAAASRRDCELCCDAAVIRQLGPERRADYGRTLLRLAGSFRPVTSFCTVTTLSGGRRQLKRRIRAIARWAKPRKWAILLAALIALLAAGCAFSGAKPSPEAPADPEPPALTAEDALDALAGSVAYADGAVSFTVPAGYPAPDDWRISLAGGAAGSDGSPTLLHPLEEVLHWEAGKTYTVPLDGLTELYLTCSLPAQPERSLTLWPRPEQLSDTDLTTRAGVALGMTYGRVLELIGTPDETLDAAPGMQAFLHDGVLYTFYQDPDGADYHLTGLSTDFSADFLWLDVGVGSTLEQALTRLGVPDTDPDLGAQQLYGESGQTNSAVLTPASGGGWFLSAWAQAAGLQITFDSSGTAVQVSVYQAPAAAGACPVSDADLVTADGAALGMTYDEVLALLGSADEYYDDPWEGSPSFRKDGVYYGFARWSDGAGHLVSFTADGAPGDGMPLGLRIGDPLETVLERLGADGDPPDSSMLYGRSGMPCSASFSLGGDGLRRIQILTESSHVLEITFGRDGCIASLSCLSEWNNRYHLMWQAFTDDRSIHEGSTFWETVNADDNAFGLIGVVLYQDPESGNSFHLGFCLPDDQRRPYLYSLGVGETETGSLLEFQQGTLRYLGGGRVTCVVRDSGTGALSDYTVSYSSDGGGSTAFTADSQPRGTD